jgi:amino acid permease
VVWYHWDLDHRRLQGQPHHYRHKNYLFSRYPPQGYESFATRKWPGIIAAYILIPWFLILLIGWKVWHNDKFTPVDEIDLQDGKREIDIEEENWHIRMGTRPPQPWWKRMAESTGWW